ncbi:MAG: beta-lactamase family protein [Clostridia bacterium]|nr:beta-lactamase family protein [Clostridia bacterium]
MQFDREKLLEKVLLTPAQGYALYIEQKPTAGPAAEKPADPSCLEIYHGETYPGSGIPIGPDTNFRMASVTKQFVARGIMRLIEKGVSLPLSTAGCFGYETALAEIFPDLPSYLQGITIRQLLNHISGVHEYDDMDESLVTGDPAYSRGQAQEAYAAYQASLAAYEAASASGSAVASARLSLDPQHFNGRQVRDPDVLAFLRSEPGLYPEAGTYRYSNSGYVLLGLIIETLSGEPIEDFLRREVLLSFGMQHSYINREGESVIPNRVFGSAWIPTTPTDSTTAAECGCLVFRDQGRTTATIGDGALYSNITDLKTYLDWLIQSDLAATYDVKTPVEPSLWYSKGMRIIDVPSPSGDPDRDAHIYYHTGGTTGTHSLIGVVPERDLRFAFMSNMDEIDASLMLGAIRALL